MAMTPEEHNKFLGWAHIGYGAFFTFLGLAMGLFFVIFGAAMSSGSQGRGEPPGLLFAGIGVFIAILYGILGLPSIFAGYGFLKRKSWAKMMGIISGVLSAMSFPFGTAVCVYTFWFLFSEPGKLLYDQQSAPAQRWQQPPDWRTPEGLNPPQANDWNNQTTHWDTRRRETHAPANPPDWRS